MPELAVLLQAGSSPLMSKVMQTAAVAFVFVLVMSVGAWMVFRNLRKANDGGIKAQLDAEFDKSKNALLLAAAAKKQKVEGDEAAKRELAAEAKERELLRENVDIDRVLGQTDPLSGLEMMADMELIVDPYTGQGYLLPSFLNDWPADSPRPKYVYRHPQGTVVKTTDLVRSY
jgi:hypothetical protein